MYKKNEQKRETERRKSEKEREEVIKEWKIGREQREERKWKPYNGKKHNKKDLI